MNHENARPTGTVGAGVESKQLAGAGSLPMLPAPADNAPAADPVDLTGVVNGVLVVVVRTPEPDPRYRRRVFLTLASAERSVQRARGRGQHAEVVLCELRPVIGR